MTCAALHRSLGVNASFVRSLTMDQWTDKQLKYMALGGNKNQYDFFQDFDLNSESIQTRYKTKAAQFYRDKLKKLVEGEPFVMSTPDFESGREVMQEQMRSSEEIMKNNPPFQGGKREEAEDNSFFGKLTTNPLGLISDTTYSLVETAGGVVMKAGETVEYGINDPNAAAHSAFAKAQTGASKVKETGLYAAGTIKDTGFVVASMAKETASSGFKALSENQTTGPVVNKGAEIVGAGFGAASWFGSALIKKVKTYVVEQPEEEHKSEPFQGLAKQGDAVKEEEKN
jgi:hypothetical protein